MGDATNRVTSVAVTFGECRSGWISIQVNAAGQSVDLGASELSDPFPDMIGWLEAAVTGAAFCHWGVDQENRATSLLLIRRRDGLARLLASGFEHTIGVGVPVIPAIPGQWGEVAIDVLVDPMQMARAFFTAFDTYVHSDRYRPTEWERIALRRVLERVLPGTALADLADLAPADLALLGNALFRPGEALWQATPAAQTLAVFIEQKRAVLMAPWEVGDVFPTDVVEESGDPLEVPADFSEMSVELRTEFLGKFLDSSVTAWDGGDPAELLACPSASAIRAVLEGH
ncbi:MAG: hypothetical protein HY985_02180 [Magnetospirillum sp.]|nr:hypothetical protein [Magnetospirillum sp.]